jgi:hypothetical protein
MENGEDAKEAEGKCPEADAVINIVYSIRGYYYSVGRQEWSSGSSGSNGQSQWRK